MVTLLGRAKTSASPVTDLAGACRAVTVFRRHSRRQSRLVHGFSVLPDVLVRPALVIWSLLAPGRFRHCISNDI